MDVAHCAAVEQVISHHMLLSVRSFLIDVHQIYDGAQELRTQFLEGWHLCRIDGSHKKLAGFDGRIEICLEFELRFGNPLFGIIRRRSRVELQWLLPSGVKNDSTASYSYIQKGLTRHLPWVSRAQNTG